MPVPKNIATSVFTLRLTPATSAAVRQAAETDEQTIADFCRAAIKAELRKRGLDPAKFREARA